MINFDNVLNGYVAILQIATLEGWEELSIEGIDSAETVDAQPSPESRPAMWAYIFLVVLVNGLYVMQLLVGILVEKFQQLKRQYENAGVEHLMSESQKQMVKALRKIVRRRPINSVTSTNRFQKFCSGVALSGKLDVIISIVIIVNMLSTSAVHIDRHNETVYYIVGRIELVCTIFYVIEATLKICGLMWYYFLDAWNCFDFSVTLISVVGTITEFTSAVSGRSGVVVF